MSQDNVEIVKRAMDAFNQSNALVGASDPLPWLREFCDYQVELDLSGEGSIPRSITATRASYDSVSRTTMSGRRLASR
jgi:hypothetical protein